MAVHDYSPRQVDKLVGLSKALLRSLTEQGLVQPNDAGRFSMQDLVVLRAAKGLRDARVSPRKILQALKNVRAGLPSTQHLASVRLRASGAEVQATDSGGLRDALSGQMLLPLDRALDGAPETTDVSQTPEATQTPEVFQTLQTSQTSQTPQTPPTLDAPPTPHAPPPARDARYWCRQAVRLEASDTVAAEHAYQRAIVLDPCHAAAYVNLGALLCETNRCSEAVALYDQALEHCGDTPLVHFNRGAALEDSGRPALAVDAYKRALELDEGLADAHYNLGVLMERLGDNQASLRHFNAYRRLHRQDEG